jgi:hypothetical protein
LTTTQGKQLGFVIASDFAPVGMGDGFARQGRFQTFLDQTLLERLDFVRGPVIR